MQNIPAPRPPTGKATRFKYSPLYAELKDLLFFFENCFSCSPPSSGSSESFAKFTGSTDVKPTGSIAALILPIPTFLINDRRPVFSFIQKHFYVIVQEILYG